MKVELEPSSDRFDPLDDRWLAQVTHLIEDLRREVGEVSRRNEPVAGAKGADLGAIVLDLESVITSLGSAGAFAAVAAVVRAFVGRDRGRLVRVRWYANGEFQQIEIRGHGTDDAERLAAALQQAVPPAK